MYFLLLVISLFLTKKDLLLFSECSENELFENKVAPSFEKNFADRNGHKLLNSETIISTGSVTYGGVMDFQLKRRGNGYRLRRRKEKRGNSFENRNKSKKMDDTEMKQILRNNEKVDLVRNKTMEILKSGVKILSASENYSPGNKKSLNHVNETLLEKILSSASSKPSMLISASGLYKLPIGNNVYESKGSVSYAPIKEEKITKGKGDNNRHTKKENSYVNISTSVTLSRSNQISFKRMVQDYEGMLYDKADKSNINNRFDDITYIDGDDISVGKNIKMVLEKIAATLRNLTLLGKSGDSNCTGGITAKDSCAKWLECRNHLEMAFIGQNHLPSCPCQYPSSIFYNSAIWDENQKRYFRWRDASGEGEHLNIYKPGAAYCIRSLLEQECTGISSQQCCYDLKLQLITRGSGAGTINFVSPDVSKTLHDTVDILPWRLCKGDFTRYNIARYPDNGKNCSVNPDEEQYQYQVKTSTFY